MNALVLCDDFWHPAHVPREGLAALGECGFTFDFQEDATEWSAETMNGYPLVILTKSNNITAKDPRPWMSEAIEQAFVSYVQAGNGLLVLHSGAAGYENAATLCKLMGGVFTNHPPQCRVTVSPLAGVAPALTADVEPFNITDEHYHMALDDPQACVFLHTTSEHGQQPGGWTRREGAGRVCMLTPGHNLDVWLMPGFQKLLTNSMRWCTRQTQ
jgi:type 1 glutamine amidotransferase